MEIVLAEQMRKIDSFCIENLLIPSIVLMENAALRVLNNIDLNKYENITIICGSGNNGGDGLALARHLLVMKKNVKVFIIGEKSKLTVDCGVNYSILCNMNIIVEFINSYEGINSLKSALDKSTLLVDAIFGTGLSREVKGVFREAILLINNCSAFVLSIDIPSGLNSDTGEVLGCAVKAHRTVSFQYYKRGFLRYGSEDYTGKVVIENIGIPDLVKDEFNLKEFISEKSFITESIPVRGNHSHKGDFGRVSIIAGSRDFTGAAYIATEAAVRSGSGLVTLCCHDSIKEIMCNKLIEAMTVSFKDRERLNDVLMKSDAIAIGPGMGDSVETFKILKDVIQYTNCPIVIDADGINVLKNNLNILKEKKNKVVLTPHLGEMSRITGIPADTIKRNRVDIAKSFAKEYNVIVLLKGFKTVITDGDTLVINSTGNSAMASGGMGDCLTGIITSFIGQGLEPLKAAYVAAYIHGYCGDSLSEKNYCVTAREVIKKLPFVIKELTH
ncbi:bifunctional NAD(P)H-hydrate repair enzyme Nnr [Clostridium homopropionicum DSM 5847]|uniref:Bifunctional NAD(P)H-hydrate repair enzyme n=1 Tax=Clostridium homopropionicum DSM 5847 TaxID=1121318 RepID=A0A0L6Z9H3_9CLOT|nr:bifunctional ADP-dependent NAD(P)H-hydrate dehydratase/NAD(P)H-hydrate epimerase [Clostridium homopropionicum]KOA19622.1 bifunctional NAD(P)H-hydrate repair enzyme Nnr [Clostridium homopropionicum DSM 5847]SFF81493.1 NAD(P)H-hydrate epimerase [Clostridium homopropionicum]